MTGVSMILPLTLAAFYLGWNLGANDGANCIGTSIGAGLISFRRGALLVAVFVVLGAMLQGERVVGTVGRGVVQAELPALAVLFALLSGGVVVSLATLLKIPVSTSQAVVGGLVGAAWSIGASVNTSVVSGIFVSWLVCPAVAGVLGAAVYLMLRFLLRRVRWTSGLERVLGWGVLASGCYAAYSLGANNVANAVGPLGNLRAMSTPFLLVLGGGSIAVGVLTFGRGVAESVGKGIVPLDLAGALAAQTATGLAVHTYALVGIPVSTSHAVVGAVVGVGLVRGIRAVGKRKITEICVGWVATPAVSGGIAYALSRLLVSPPV